MPFVYILQSLSKNRYYIGCTHDIEKRMHRHNSGYEFSTKSRLPIKLVLKQHYQTMSQARKIEQRLKKLKRKDYLEKMIISGEIRLK